MHIHTQRQKESGKVGNNLWKKLWKFQVDETNFGSVILV